MTIRNLRLILSLALLLVISGCGMFSASPDNPGSDPNQIATGVAATLTAIAEQSPDPAAGTPAPPEDTRPAWLDDPERITGPTLPPELYGLAYRKDANWLVDRDGISKLFMGQPANGAISPDGTGYLISGQPPTGEDIYYYNIAAGEITQWTDTPNLQEANYHWWPARPNVIVYNFVPVDELGPWYGYLAAFVIPTSETIIIEDTYGSGTTFALSPDGERIAYLQDSQPAIYTWDTGSEPINMAEFGLDYSSYSAPAWSSDGTKLAFHATGQLQDAGVLSAVIVLDPDAGTAEVLDEYISFGQRVGPELAFSPDGQWLASVNPGEQTADGQPASMWLFPLNGGEPVALGYATSPFWSPDGQYLLYTRWPNVGNSSQHQIIMAEAGSWSGEPVPELAGTFILDWLDLP